VTDETAERWIVASAMVVAGVWGYRRLREGTASPSSLKNVVGVGAPAPLGQFAVAWGTVYLTLAVVALGAPELAGAFAILIMAGDLLTNSKGISDAITAKVSSPSADLQTASAQQIYTASGLPQSGGVSSLDPSFPGAQAQAQSLYRASGLPQSSPTVSTLSPVFPG
jgi:hypothetical protein